mmetsp:Transcript_37176/g.79305  ORF Transcript_37176/g.79305 Transcript_37176/m.79305 type:complete len:207 (-) Transcript_37176:918-1538(-)
MSSGASVRKMAELASLLLIFPCAPWRGGKNLEWIRAGFPPRGWCLGTSLWATSRVRRKYGSWSMAHGMRHARVAGLVEEAPPPPPRTGDPSRTPDRAWRSRSCTPWTRCSARAPSPRSAPASTSAPPPRSTPSSASSAPSSRRRTSSPSRTRSASSPPSAAATTSSTSSTSSRSPTPSTSSWRPCTAASSSIASCRRATTTRRRRG